MEFTETMKVEEEHHEEIPDKILVCPKAPKLKYCDLSSKSISNQFDKLHINHTML